jgi:hypothetical protein
MPKKIIKKYMPSPESIKENKNLQFLGDKLHDPNLGRLARKNSATTAEIIICPGVGIQATKRPTAKAAATERLPDPGYYFSNHRLFWHALVLALACRHSMA